jgi:hypothetical protein
MKEEKKTEVKVVQSTFPFFTLATIMLLILKITKVIDIGWIWVFSPLWIPALITIGILIIFGIIVLFIAIIAAITDH